MRTRGVMLLGVIAALARAVGAGEVSCVACHTEQAGELAESVHEHLSCTECHGGPRAYELTSDEVAASRPGAPDASFDHGDDFRGKPARTEVPERCGSCHAEVERMNPYGLRTDQLARYRTSGHGQTLARTGDARVAVCTDCHGSHGVLPGGQPTSPTNPRNVPETCARCHADEELMADFGLSADIVAEYRQSVHGRTLLEDEDVAAPSCATCHGNHAAAPPGVASVHAVCGQCHDRTAEQFSGTIHALMDGFKGCLQCHGGGPERHGHLIARAMPHPDEMERRYARLLGRKPDAGAEQVVEAVHPELRRLIEGARPGCLECHEAGEEAMETMSAVVGRIEHAERTYLRTARRLDSMRRGVLLVDDEAFRFRDARTDLVDLAPVQHGLDLEEIDAVVERLQTVAGEVDARLDDKERRLRLRRLVLVPVWLFALGFAAALYAKYRRLAARHAREADHGD